MILFSKPAVPRHELLTANNQVPYMFTVLNLRQGPMVHISDVLRCPCIVRY